MNMTEKRDSKAVFGIFKHKFDLERAISDLKNREFRNSDISVLMPSKEETQNFAHERATKIPEGTAMGATGGLAVGGTLGWLAGIGALAIPGIGPFIAAGPIVAAIAGAGVGGVLGGMAGALIGIGIPDYEAKKYANIVKGGGILLSVHVDDILWEKRAKEILLNSGATDISSPSDETEAPYQTFIRKPGSDLRPDLRV